VRLLPYTASSVGVARRLLIGELTGAGVDEATARDAGLVISELISNALRHATPLPGSLVKVSWTLGDDCLEVAVSDGGGATEPEVNQPTASAIGGRGLGIVDRLSLCWGAYRHNGEATVWAALALSGDAEHSRQNGARVRSPDRNGSGPSLAIA
jgi:anti-sigma regulatory factor (Ser/Thr protein kinase)